MNLYFGGVQSSPGISGVQNLTNTQLLAGGHPNGLDIFGAAGHAGSGTLSAMIDGYLVTLTAFSWITGQRSAVRDRQRPFRLLRESAPEPGTFALLLLGLGGLGVMRRRVAIA